jgi:hypothetical protein
MSNIFPSHFKTKKAKWSKVLEHRDLAVKRRKTPENRGGEIIPVLKSQSVNRILEAGDDP